MSFINSSIPQWLPLSLSMTFYIFFQAFLESIHSWISFTYSWIEIHRGYFKCIVIVQMATFTWFPSSSNFVTLLKELLIVSDMICSLWNHAAYCTWFHPPPDFDKFHPVRPVDYVTVDIRLTRPPFSGSLLSLFDKCVLSFMYSKTPSLYCTVDSTVTEISLVDT